MSNKLLRKMIDIGGNLTDPMFKGIYNSSTKHENDMIQVLDRSKHNGIERIIITGGTLGESIEALTIAKMDSNLYSTVGCHPTRCLEFENHYDGPESYLSKLQCLAYENKGKVVAIGEIGLDYDRLKFCPKDVQLKYFEKQLTLAKETQLPLFLHNRNSSEDFFKILNNHKDCFSSKGGVVHSFDGSEEDVKNIINLNLFIGINGCSLKTRRNLDVLKKIPAERLLIETDCPWCGIKQSHESFKYVDTKFPTCKKEKHNPELQVKDRNEPTNLIQVLEVISKVRADNIDKLSEQIYTNTNKLFF